MDDAGGSLVVNGERRNSAVGITISHLLVELGLVPEVVLIELNGEPTRRSDWPATSLHDGDRIEILRVAAGG